MAVKLPSVFGRAMSMKPPRGQMCSACRLQDMRSVVSCGDGQLLVVVVEPSSRTLMSPARARLARTAEPAPSVAKVGAIGTVHSVPVASSRKRSAPAFGRAAEAGLPEAQPHLRVARRFLDQHAVEGARPTE